MSDVKPTNVRVEYRVAATIALPNFQNVKPEYCLSADVPDGVNPTVVRDKLKAMVEVWMDQDIEQIRAEAR